MRRTAVVILCGVLVAGCGKGSDNDPVVQTVTTTATTKVEVLKALESDGAARRSSSGGGFDPQRIYARESPGVVTIVSTGLRGGGGSGAGLGSGFVVSDKGEILTNAHVVTSGEGASIAPAEKVYVRFNDGNQVEAKIRGYDPFSDVALVKVDPTGLTLRPLPLGSTRDLRVGAPVAAIGSPFGEEQSLSVGVVSATDRSIDSLTGFATTGAIQTDAAINHGNSGGPLLDGDGRVLGINSQIRSETGEGSGVGFAIPVDVVRRALHQLRVDGKVKYAYLGVSSRALYPQVADRFGLGGDKGVWVQTVEPDGPAAKAGVKAAGPSVEFQEQSWRTGGDVVVGVDDTKVSDDDDLSQALLPHVPGDTVVLHLLRDGKPLDVKVTLGERPLNDPDRG